MLIVVIVVALICFAGVLLVGAPYVPTLRQTQTQALQLLDLRPGQHLLELGCGDGRVLRAAARQGIRATGYELNPILWGVAVVTTWQYRHLVTVRWGNFWAVDWPTVDGIYVFLQDRFMGQLHKKIVQQYGGKKVKIVSYAFQIPNKKATKMAHGLYLYEYR